MKIFAHEKTLNDAVAFKSDLDRLETYCQVNDDPGRILIHKSVAWLLLANLTRHHQISLGLLHIFLE